MKIKSIMKTGKICLASENYFKYRESSVVNEAFAVALSGVGIFTIIFLAVFFT